MTSTLSRIYSPLKRTPFVFKLEPFLKRKYIHIIRLKIAPTINDYVETASFPTPLIEKLKAIKPLQHFLKAPYGKEISSFGKGAIAAEFARIDAGFATFLVVQ